MNKSYFSVSLFMKLLLTSISLNLDASDKSISPPWGEEYQKCLMKKVAEKLPMLVTYPFYRYPNQGHKSIPERFPNGKVVIFGYGSLMNKQSAARSIKSSAIETMSPVIAFGVKRMFNYKANKTDHWGRGQNSKEKAMLNLVQTLNISSLANGVTMEVDSEDLTRLVRRETGYDLVPILISSWKDITQQNPELEIHIAYTFVATNELRNHIDYTSTEFYPVRGYLHAVREAAEAYGIPFSKMWNGTTYLADGTTCIEEWDGTTFKDILWTIKP